MMSTKDDRIKACYNIRIVINVSNHISGEKRLSIPDTASFPDDLDRNCDYILGNRSVLKLLNLAPEAVQRDEKMYLQMILLIDGDFLDDPRLRLHEPSDIMALSQ